MDTKTILEQIGMTPRQAKIYLAGLEIGLSPASSFASRTQEKRVTVYQTLREMVALGYAREVMKNKTKYYQIIDPDQLLLINQKRLQDLQDSVPLLFGMMNERGSKPQIEYYEGREQLKDVFKYIIDQGVDFPNEEYMSFVGVQDIDADFAEWLEHDFKEYRKKSPLPTRSIVTTQNHPYIVDYTIQEHEHITINYPEFMLNQEIVLFPNRKIAVLMYARKELSARIIQSPSFYQSIKSFFDVIWDAYKK